MKSILIVDDEHLVRESFSDFFEDKTWRVMKAESSEQALAILEIESVRLALVDIRLPGIDGNAFIRKALAKAEDMMFAICTGLPTYKLPSDLAESEKVLNHFFTKPVRDLHALEKKLSELIDCV